MTTIQTVGDICNLIAANLNSNNKVLANHAKTLLGPRTEGSTTRLPLSSVNKSTPVELFDTPQLVRAKCYIFDTPENMGAMIGVLPLLNIQMLGLAQSVVIREGKHGKHLYLIGGESFIQPARDICVIVGQFGNETAVFTWHPGKPLAVLPQNFILSNEKDFSQLNPMVAVKLI
jgi:hypothetical protein